MRKVRVKCGYTRSTEGEPITLTRTLERPDWLTQWLTDWLTDSEMHGAKGDWVPAGRSGSRCMWTCSLGAGKEGKGGRQAEDDQAATRGGEGNRQWGRAGEDEETARGERAGKNLRAKKPGGERNRGVKREGVQQSLARLTLLSSTCTFVTRDVKRGKRGEEMGTIGRSVGRSVVFRRAISAAARDFYR